MKNASDDATTEPAYLIRSADHVLKLLRLVAERGALRVAEAAAILGVAPSTAHRLLGTLRHEGFVVQDRRGAAYLPGPGLSELAMSTFRGIDIRLTARPVLERLVERLQETVSLLVLEDNRVRFIDSIEGPRSVRVTSRLGVVMPAHCTSGGKSMLAALSPEELTRRYPHHRLEVLSSHSISTWERLEADLTEVRIRRYGLNFEEGDAGIGGIGACVHDPSGGPLAAIAIACPISRFRNSKDASAIAPPLLEAVETIERFLRTGPRRDERGLQEEAG
ncbi:MAG TPA: IclR family transcriptional regulator [Acidimicrobiales bacterium]|nr:IclR family transcriptional regulator [Acidimicrobiales bacterium]